MTLRVKIELQEKLAQIERNPTTHSAVDSRNKHKKHTGEYQTNQN